MLQDIVTGSLRLCQGFSSAIHNFFQTARSIQPGATVWTLPLSLSSSQLTSEVLLTEDGAQPPPIQSFNIPVRYPLRKYSALINALLVALLGLVGGKDIWQFATGVIAGVFPGKSANTQNNS